MAKALAPFCFSLSSQIP
uniref:Uncharacterized protein n=1 Tax=Anguilla anguilla TaxID=7936 RepID=A0A0E9UJD9_ANGAN